MSACRKVWNLLHDAVIVGIAGTLPGTLELDLQVDYLRTRFADPGNRPRLSLEGCREFVFRDWNADNGIATDLTVIADKHLWILRDRTGERCTVHCSEYMVGRGGTLEVSADQTLLALDSGRITSLDELSAVADAYWTEWESRSGEKPPRLS